MTGPQFAATRVPLLLCPRSSADLLPARLDMSARRGFGFSFVLAGDGPEGSGGRRIRRKRYIGAVGGALQYVSEHGGV